MSCNLTDICSDINDICNDIVDVGDAVIDGEKKVAKLARDLWVELGAVAEDITKLPDLIIGGLEEVIQEVENLPNAVIVTILLIIIGFILIFLVIFPLIALYFIR